MNKKWFVMTLTAVLVAASALLAFGNVSFAQGPTPTPTTPNTTPTTTPNMAPGWGLWGHGPMMGRGFGHMERGFGMMGRGFGMHDGFGMGRGFGGMMGGPENSLIATAAKVIGIDTTDLLTQLQGGKTIAQVAQEKNISTDQIVNEYLNARSTVLKAAVDAGQITQAQADAMLNLMKVNATTRLNAQFNIQGFGIRWMDSDGDGVCDWLEQAQSN